MSPFNPVAPILSLEALEVHLLDQVLQINEIASYFQCKLISYPVVTL
jgi:hypothetical protein